MPGSRRLQDPILMQPRLRKDRPRFGFDFPDNAIRPARVDLENEPELEPKHEDGPDYAFEQDCSGEVGRPTVVDIVVIWMGLLPHVWGEEAKAGRSRAQKRLFFEALRIGAGLSGPKSVVTISSGN